MDYQIVVARYKENIEWVKQLRDCPDFSRSDCPDVKNGKIFIYNKGGDFIENAIPRKNVGREVESFLYHIINHYHDLPDYLILLQGNPFDHMFCTIYPDNFQQLIDILLSCPINDIQSFFINTISEEHYKYPCIQSKEYYSYFFEGNVPDTSIFAPGCQYIIPKKNILCRPLQFYMKIHAMTLNTKILTQGDSHFTYCDFDYQSINGWCLERLLMFLFKEDIPISAIMKQKRYLITGGAGFIGSTLVNRLSNENTIVILDNLTTGDFNYIQMNNNIHFIEGNVLDDDTLLLTGYVDGIFHFAAMSKVLPSLENKEMVRFCIEQNVLGTANLLKYASSFNNPIKVVYSASSTYYGLNEIPNVETQYPDCQTPYALSKYCGELACEMYYKLYSVPNVRLRYFMVYGPNEPSTGSYAIVTGIFLKRQQDNLPLIIHGDGLQTRDFVHVDDICQANILAMNCVELVNDTINVGTGEMVSIKELADLISPHQIHVEARKVDLKHTLCDTAKLKERLNWIPTKRIKDYIVEMIRKGHK
jgi:nucleoside-diphosphate-sugar epimerase